MGVSTKKGEPQKGNVENFGWSVQIGGVAKPAATEAQTQINR
jgi:hypothetical protein